MWLINLNGENISKVVEDIAIATDEFIDGIYFDEVEFRYIDFNDLPDTDTLKFTVELHSISREYFDFLIAIAIESEESFLFDGPPANVPSNVNNGALGFFRASAISSFSVEEINPK